MSQGKSWERMLQGSAYQIKSKNYKNYTAHSETLRWAINQPCYFWKNLFGWVTYHPCTKYSLKGLYINENLLRQGLLSPGSTKNKIFKNYKKEWHISEKWTSS